MTKRQLHAIHDALIQHGASLAVHDLFLRAVAATHPDPGALQKAFVAGARLDDSKASALPNPDAYRRYYDSAYSGLLKALQRPAG